jgi:hypothetical protein
MKDSLQDLVSHIHGLVDIDVIKIMGTAQDTSFAAVSQREDGKIVIEGSLTTPDPEFIGTFGMPNLVKLKTILGFEEYNENANIYTNRDNEGVAKSINFENKNKDFVNSYRLMAESIVVEKVKTVIFKGTTWNIEFAPTVDNIMRLKKQAQANAEENLFKVKVENGDLRIHFGDPATHSGNFVFHSQVSGTLANTLQFPVSLVIQILSMVGNKTMRISERGILEITIDSGIATYRYLVPAHGK